MLIADTCKCGSAEITFAIMGVDGQLIVSLVTWGDPGTQTPSGFPHPSSNLCHN